MFIPAYKKLLKEMGPSHWWPASSPFEVVVGAILTQNTNWKNVERALSMLKEKKMLSPKKMSGLPEKKLAIMIHSSGYYNQKARKLKVFLDWFSRNNFSFAQIKNKYKTTQNELRNELLGLFGIGPETADSILCYALTLPFFVVDAYTFRWLERYRPDTPNGKYEILRGMVEAEFKKTFPATTLTQHFNEFHALIVRLGHQFCLKQNPKCAVCSLRRLCETGLKT